MSDILTDSQIDDLVTTTLPFLQKDGWTQAAQRLQEYEFFSHVMKKERVVFDNGTSVQRRIMLDHSNAAKMVGLNDQDAVSVGDVMGIIDVPWRQTNTHYGFERRELLKNSGAAKIVDLLKVRRTDALISLAELLEDQFWSKPDNSADILNLWGVPYWVVSGTSTGFTGLNPDGFPGGAGGLDSTVNERWANWWDQWTNFTKTDAVKKMRKAYRKIRFKSPVTIDDFRGSTGDNYRIYMNETTISAAEDLGEAQNENLGRDIASMDGMMVFRRNPIVWVPKLDEDLTDPIYMINYNYFYAFFLKGDYMRESDPIVPWQHNSRQVHIDNSLNLFCSNRRCMAKLSH